MRHKFKPHLGKFFSLEKISVCALLVATTQFAVQLCTIRTSLRHCVCTCPDGRPLPVKGVDEVGQLLYSVDLEWDEPPTPADSPITSYVISVIPQDSGRQVSPALKCCVCGQTLFCFRLPSLLISLFYL